LGAAWLRLYVDLTSTAEAEMRMVKRSKRTQERFERAAGPEPIHPPFWHRTRRHPTGSIDLGVDRVRARALRVPIRCLRRTRPWSVSLAGARRWPSPASSMACSHSQSRGR
jgi:hypothetical protein